VTISIKKSADGTVTELEDLGAPCDEMTARQQVRMIHAVILRVVRDEPYVFADGVTDLVPLYRQALQTIDKILGVNSMPEVPPKRRRVMMSIAEVMSADEIAMFMRDLDCDFDCGCRDD